MTLVLVLLLVVVVGLAVAVTVGFIGGGLPRPATDIPPPIDGPVGEPADLDRARFQLAFRGYRMDQVDRVLDDARDALAARDDEIARLRRAAGDGDTDGQLSGPATDMPSPEPSPESAPAGDPFRRPDGSRGSTPATGGERSEGEAS